MFAKRSTHTRKEPANKWTEGKMFDGVLGTLAEEASFRVGVADKCRHPSRSWPCVKKEFNVNNKGSGLDFVMGKLDTVSNAVNYMSNGNLKFKE